MKRPVKMALGVVVVLVLAAVALFAPTGLGGSTRIFTTIEIARSPADVFDYVTTPGNWPKWHPSSLGVSGATDHSLAVGETVVEEFLVAGRRGKVTWRVIERDTGKRWRIAGTIDGREAGVITYALVPIASGARFEREFIYGSPNLLFALINRLSLRAQVDAESRLALEQLKKALETSR
jgi:uncharacterized protein YndB with AHSA1/START domain